MKIITINIFSFWIAIFGLFNSASADMYSGPSCTSRGSENPTCKLIQITNKVELSQNLKNLFYRVNDYYDDSTEKSYYNIIDLNTESPLIFESSTGLRGESFSDDVYLQAISKAYYDKNIKVRKLIDPYSGICEPPSWGRDRDEVFCSKIEHEGRFLFDENNNKVVLINEFENNYIGFIKRSGLSIKWDENGGEGYISIINPLKSVEVFYKSGDSIENGKIALYKIKEIHYFDDGSKKEFNFEVPKIEEPKKTLTPPQQQPEIQKTQEVKPPQPEPEKQKQEIPAYKQSFWAWLVCLVKWIFGNKC